jgi:hypothetical protein
MPCSIPKNKSDPKKTDISNGIAHHFEYHRLYEDDSTNILLTVLPEVKRAIRVARCC